MNNQLLFSFCSPSLRNMLVHFSLGCDLFIWHIKFLDILGFANASTFSVKAMVIVFIQLPL